MLKGTAILRVALIVFCAYCGAEQVQAENGHQSPAAPVAAVAQQDHHGQPLDREQKQDIHCNAGVVDPPQKDFYDKAPVWTNIVLVIVALGTGIVIGWQSWETRKSAQGALRSAQAQMDANRAWMIPKISQPSIDDVLLHQEKPSGWVLPIEITVTNRGQTPATVVSAANCHSSEKVIDPKEQSWILDLPEPPKYVLDPIKQPPGSLYLAGDKMTLPLTVPIDFIENEIGTWRKDEKCLCIRGFVEYLDTFNKPHITRYCYCFQHLAANEWWGQTRPAPPEYLFRKAGPSAYNDIT